MLNDLKLSLINIGVKEELFGNEDIRIHSICYMFYWVNRLKNNKEEQQKMLEHLLSYLRLKIKDEESVLKVISKEDIINFCNDYVLTKMPKVETIDLVVERNIDNKKQVLLYKRNIFPEGLALAGGIINDEDESNEYEIEPSIFSALRVGADKVLELKYEDRLYARKVDDKNREYFSVSNKNNTKGLIIHPTDLYGYNYFENIKNVIRPSDPRHIVLTKGFKCELFGDINEKTNDSYVWVDKAELLKPEQIKLSFSHHKEIIFHILAKSNLEKELDFEEEFFIRNLINNPLKEYEILKNRFENNKNNINTSFPELFPVVNKLLNELFSEKINKICNKLDTLNGLRDKVVISLRHVTLKNRTFCPYSPTVRAIFEAVAFFDIIARYNRNFYGDLPTDKIIEHNPKERPFASYHMYRYKYRLDDIFSMFPSEILIPTFASLSATDLMKVRGIPIRFVGLSTEFLYVDEFEQSPEEFLMHDCNHSWRMIMEDNLTCKELNISKSELIKSSNIFIEEYLSGIKIKKEDSEKEKELKKIKKIILFEIVHEDARPFLKEIIGEYIQVKEGGEVRFELPRIDPITGYMDVVDTLDTGISTLSYVRNKLQHGFYDQVDSQLPQIVSPEYRKSKYIAEAAYQMLRELKSKPSKLADLGTDGLPTYEWLLRRTCSVGPDNIHNSNEADEILKEYSDGAEKLNPKRYQA